MDARQLMVCASALFADGHSFKAIAKALGVTAKEAQQLAMKGADEQSKGTLGHMAPTKDAKGKAVIRKDMPNDRPWKSKPYTPPLSNPRPGQRQRE